MYHPYPDDRAKAIERAQMFIGLDPLFLDTETTGLTDTDQICEIAVLDLAGEVLINSLVKPTKPIPPGASQIHGITDDLVEDAPAFIDVFPQLEGILRGRTVLVYNVEFDLGMVWRSALNNGISMEAGWQPWWVNVEGDPQAVSRSWYCAMELYAQFYGEWNDYHQSYRWQRLSTAARQCNVELPADIHRAHADAEMTRRIVLHMATAGASQLQFPLGEA